jgi:O-methyltransferase
MKKIILNNIRAFLEDKGFYIYKPAKINNSTEFEIRGLSYGVVFPKANYSPWRNDQAFNNMYSKMKDNTLVDIFRCYELWTLADEVLKISNDLNFIEIGVWRGGTAAILTQKMEKNKGKGKVFLADTFTGVVKTSDEDTYYSGGEHKDTSKEIVVKLLSDLGLKRYEILQGIFPDDTAHLIPNDLQFGICHIDVDVYLSAKGCLEWVWDKLAIGGMVVFDDYGFHTCDGVAKLVEAQRQYKDRLVIHNLNGHGLIIKIA